MGHLQHRSSFLIMYQAIAFIAPLAGLAAASSVPVDTYEYDQVEFKVINKDIQFRKLDGVCRNAHGGAGSPKVLQVSKDVCEKVCTDDPRCYAYEFRPHDNCELHLEEIESAEFVPHAPHATCNSPTRDSKDTATARRRDTSSNTSNLAALIARQSAQRIRIALGMSMPANLLISIANSILDT